MSRTRTKRPPDPAEVVEGPPSHSTSTSVVSVNTCTRSSSSGKKARLATGEQRRHMQPNPENTDQVAICFNVPGERLKVLEEPEEVLVLRNKLDEAVLLEGCIPEGLKVRS